MFEDANGSPSEQITLSGPATQSEEANKLKKELKEKTGKISQLEKQITQASQKHKAELAQLKNQIGQLKTNINNMKQGKKDPVESKDEAELKKTIDELQTQVSRLKCENGALKSQASKATEKKEEEKENKTELVLKQLASEVDRMKKTALKKDIQIKDLKEGNKKQKIDNQTLRIKLNQLNAGGDNSVDEIKQINDGELLEDLMNCLSDKIECPISLKQMQIPCITPSGRTIDEVEMDEIIRKNKMGLMRDPFDSTLQ